MTIMTLVLIRQCVAHPIVQDLEALYLFVHCNRASKQEWGRGAKLGREWTVFMSS